MEWVLRSPQIHSMFGSLGFAHADGYHVDENCNNGLETILYNILTEDKSLRTYRLNICFGQYIKKDLIPLLLHAKEETTIELTIKVLVNLTVPIECLLPIEIESKTDFGRHKIFELNNLLDSSKLAFANHHVTKVIIDFMKKNIEPQRKLTAEQCNNISNCLLLLRNILHIPEDTNKLMSNSGQPSHSVQNQILWNIFSQSIDKLLIKLMTIPELSQWGVTMVQLIALLYKDQHVVTLQKLLNFWLESCLSESSDDNESNTSPQDIGSENSSPILTSDPTSDSSDTGGSGKSNDKHSSETSGWASNSKDSSVDINMFPQSFKMQIDYRPESISTSRKCSSSTESQKGDLSSVFTADEELSEEMKLSNSVKVSVKSETSDCGYVTQIENQEFMSTSSNEDDLPAQKPVHQKLHNPKQRINTKLRSTTTLQEKKRKKLVKRGKAHIINVQGLLHKTPTDDDISNILKEFTVDFLLKGFNSLVQTIHTQILTNLQLEIDTSHFFWLITYFLKFATQIEVGIENVQSVLSFDIVSFLTAEGVNLCEQLEMAIKLDGIDLKPSIRRLHLVVTAIREFVQAVESFTKLSHACNNDQDVVLQLQIKICECAELRSLLVLLLRHYNPKYHNKQYLQDLIITNHMLLLFLDNVIQLPSYNGTTNMLEHIKQFASSEIMNQYGLLLEDYAGNGEFVNDCIFTIMHHVGGDLGGLVNLFQPTILKTFTSIWKSEFKICDDWSDLIEYVINTFVNKSHTLKVTDFPLDSKSIIENNVGGPQIELNRQSTKNSTPNLVDNNSETNEWTEEELGALSWNYMQCNNSVDPIGDLVKLYKDDGITYTRESVIKQLYKQNVIDKVEFERYLSGESNKCCKNDRDDEIFKLCEQIINDGKAKSLDWVQKVLLDICYVKICLSKDSSIFYKYNTTSKTDQASTLSFKVLENTSSEEFLMSPVSYHSLVLNRAVPLVPWNCEQAVICRDLKFLQLLHKLGFHMPVDTGKVFIRIPNFWTAEVLYEIAAKISPVDTSRLKFTVTGASQEKLYVDTVKKDCISRNPLAVTLSPEPETGYRVQGHKHNNMMINFTPTPGPSVHPIDPCTSDCRNKPTWFDLVVKSQDVKLSLNMKRIKDEEDKFKALLSDTVKPAVSPAARFVPTLIGNRTDTLNIISTSYPLAQSIIPGVSQPMTIPYAPQVIPSISLPTTVMPRLMPNLISNDTDLKPPETSLFTIPLSMSEENSICETASVASDLTRMYVSDEKAKPKLVIKEDTREFLPATRKTVHGEYDNSNAGKRPRVQNYNVMDGIE